jgi:hypothetical protein
MDNELPRCRPNCVICEYMDRAFYLRRLLKMNTRLVDNKYDLRPTENEIKEVVHGKLKRTELKAEIDRLVMEEKRLLSEISVALDPRLLGQIH